MTNPSRPRIVASHMARSSPRQLWTIQAARGAAALAVVLAHAGTVLGSSQALGYVPLSGIFRAGHAGVYFFFVLSGFIITFVHRGDIGRPRMLRGYLLKRMRRIYPMYWIALALVVLLVWVGVAPTDMGDVTRGIANILLLPQHQSPLLGVSWTLQHELLFYTLFAGAIVSRRLGAIILVCWIPLMVVGWFMASDGPPWAPQSLLWDFIATPMHVQFLLGVATALAVMADLVPAPRCLFGFAVVGLACAAALENGGVIAYLGPASQALFGGFSALAIAGMATAERRSLTSVGAVPYLVGEASYAIYLVHYQAIALGISALAASGLLRTLPGWSLMLGLTAVGAGAGLGLHLLAERPLLRPRRLAAPAALPST